MGLLSIKPEVQPVCRLSAPSRNGAGVKCAVPESLLAAIKKIVHDEVRQALQEEGQKQTWIQKLKERFFT